MASGKNPMNIESVDTCQAVGIYVLNAQESSSSGSGAKGRPHSDEKLDSRGADQTCATSSQCTLDQEEGKERVPLRRRYMTRTTFQKGYVFARMTEHGKVHVIRYRV